LFAISWLGASVKQGFCGHWEMEAVVQTALQLVYSALALPVAWDTGRQSECALDTEVRSVSSGRHGGAHCNQTPRMSESHNVFVALLPVTTRLCDILPLVS
jgi:hypothetical protein